MTYQITTAPQKTMFGKRTGAIVARLESEYSGNIASAEGTTATIAKQALLDQLGALAANDQRAYLFCADQTVLVVSFVGTAWQYDIVRATQTGRSGCIMPGVRSFREAKERACDHAGQSFGGVLNAV